MGMTTSKERILAAWRGEPHDHVPFTTWSFGVVPPKELRWTRAGKEVRHWYTMRLEHIHTLPAPWELEDDFRRVLAWQSMGVDDILDVSVPWSIAPEITWVDTAVEAGVLDARYPVLIRDYSTPSGSLRHAMRRTVDEMGAGWVVQPDHVPLFEDFHIPRGVRHAVAGVEDVPVIRHLYQAPNRAAEKAFADRMSRVKPFADEHGVPVQAWSGFGMDGVVWMMGVEGALFMAMEQPAAFQELCDIVHATDVARTELALSSEGVDLVVCRGWYGSTDFWSPKLCDRFYFPYVKHLADLAHAHGKPFGLTMSTGLRVLASRIADAGVDVHYFVDPVQGNITLDEGRNLFADRTTIVGGISIVHSTEPAGVIRSEVGRAMEVLGRTNRFILHPVDSLYPDTNWDGLQTMIEAWKQCL